MKVKTHFLFINLNWKKKFLRWRWYQW